MVVTYQVLVGGVDMTAWAESVTVKQARRCFYREWSVTFRGLPSTLSGDPVVDILLAGYPVMIDGRLSPDAPPSLVFDGEVPVTTATGYDWAWRIQRIVPSRTLVVAPTLREARQLVESATEPIGRWRHLTASTARAAVTALGALAGVTIEYQIPDYTVVPRILDPRATLYEHIISYISCMAPEVFSRRERRALLIADPKASKLAGLGTIHLSADAIAGVTVKDLPRLCVQRLLIHTPAAR